MRCKKRQDFSFEKSCRFFIYALRQLNEAKQTTTRKAGGYDLWALAC